MSECECNEYDSEGEGGSEEEYEREGYKSIVPLLQLLLMLLLLLV